MELVRAAALTAYFPVARQLGLDPVPLLRSVGLPRALLHNPEQMISAEAVTMLLERSAEASGCLTFGLRMAANRSLADMGVVSLIVAHQPTLRDALAVLVRYRTRINSTLYLQMEHHDEIVILREELSLKSGKTPRQAADLALGVLVQLCGTVLGPQWHPDCACFAYPAPPPGERAIYHQLFRCRIEYDADFQGLVVNSGDLDRRNPRADPALAAHAANLIDTIMEPGQRSLTQEVEQCILLLLPSGRASLRTIAHALGMNLRTLQRHLETESSSFSELLNRVRRQQLARYLVNSRYRLTDISELLGYSSLGAFTRWHIDEFGRTPSAVRRELRAPGPRTPA
jgi:AraC-like DNA-binding protein